MKVVALDLSFHLPQVRVILSYRTPDMVKIPDIRHDTNCADFLQFSCDSSSLFVVDSSLLPPLGLNKKKKKNSLVLDAISFLFNVKNIEKLTNMLLNVLRT
jgi:hypothetical protein